MITHNRNGVQIEQCGMCRGIFLDFGELEHLTQLHMQWTQAQQAQMPAAPPMQQGQPGWGAPQQQGYGHGYRKPHKKGFMGLLFSS